ncbi:HBL/NHE enterotoxin family protein [Nostoc sp. KVJ3]|uniref:alpha-helical pore-forming toxin family protein n=1 Tax=Nostoc sp. KVJ3 TaxID=457945 RepID=UPI0022378C14|nr:alpha-helical pore-forming toxin family protein [Nostoc sp. KVJ3]MCW5315467.1 HBL/NHE enterotoxin family protein [Nostoc sp. KVJ3]
MPNFTIQAAQKIDAASKTQISQGLLIQTYCNSVLSQPNVNFSGFKTLGQYQTDINNGLTTAQGHANTYLNIIQPAIITNITNINNYYSLHSAVASTLPPGSTVEQWLTALSILKKQSTQYQTDANNIVKTLQTLHSNLTTDTASFAKTVSELNAAVNGDDGILNSINGELNSIQSKIDGAIAGTVLSSLAIVGGIFIAAVGGIADFVTVGASTPVLAGGIALVVVGVGGEVASAITLKNLNDQKANLLTQKSSLTAEVNLATGISTAYTSLKNQAGAAVTSATEMENAWNFLSSDLGNLINDLDQGIKGTGEVRQIFLTAANSTVQSVITDTTIIKNQMTGVSSSVAPSNATIGDYIVSLARQHQLAVA